MTTENDLISSEAQNIQAVEPAIDFQTTPPVKRFSPSSRKRIFSVFLMVVLVLAGGLVYALSFRNQDIRSRASLSGPSLSLVPVNKSVQSGEEFSLGIMMDTASEMVSATEISLTYDPTVVQLTSFTPNTPLPVVLLPEKYESGTVSVTLGSQPTSPFKGASIIGTFKVKVLNPKNSKIDFSSATQVVVLGKNTNALASSTGTNISVPTLPIPTTTTPLPTVTSAPTSNPSPSPTLTPLPTTTTSPIITTAPTATPIPSRVTPLAQSLIINTISLPSGVVFEAYGAVIEISKTAGSDNPSITISNLPFGIYQGTCLESSDETIVSCPVSGTPVKKGSYSVKIAVKGSNAQVDKSLLLTINAQDEFSNSEIDLSSVSNDTETQPSTNFWSSFLNFFLGR